MKEDIDLLRKQLQQDIEMYKEMQKKIELRQRMTNKEPDVCANCKKPYIAGDKYCRYCGAPKGRSDYINDIRAQIYGPLPVRIIYKCTACGYSWEENTVRRAESRWCPECGSPAPALNRKK